MLKMLKHPIVLYGTCLAAGLIALKLLEYGLFSYRISEQAFTGLTALLFTLVGIVAGILFVRSRADQPERDLPVLSHKEKQLLQGLSLGMTNQQLADENHLSINTIKTHLKTLYKKLQADSRNDAVHKAKALQLIE